jgi:hypothetical protein
MAIRRDRDNGVLIVVVKDAVEFEGPDHGGVDLRPGGLGSRLRIARNRRRGTRLRQCGEPDVGGRGVGAVRVIALEYLPAGHRIAGFGGLVGGDFIRRLRVTGGRRLGRRRLSAAGGG